MQATRDVARVARGACGSLLQAPRLVARGFAGGGDAAALSAELADRCEQLYAKGERLNLIFLGAPGVGKGTYASRIAKVVNVPHISAGDLLRDEIKRGGPLAEEMAAVTKQGKLLSDELVFRILTARLEAGRAAGEKGCLLDGFPRTAAQAAMLAPALPVRRAVNLKLREDVLVLKCCGRRVCTHCGKNYNVAEIDFPATATDPAIWMPPLPPAPECAAHLETRADDTEEVVRKRLAVYHSQCGPVEEFYRSRGLLTDFTILAGIPETMPRLLRHMIDQVV